MGTGPANTDLGVVPVFTRWSPAGVMLSQHQCRLLPARLIKHNTYPRMTTAPIHWNHAMV